MRTKHARSQLILDAIVVFADVRGFTPWAEKTDVFAFIDEFGVEMQRVFGSVFRGWTTKNLGDGAMLIRSSQKDATESSLKKLLLETLDNIRATDAAFAALCRSLSVRHGSKIPLRLGWGITKGHIKRAGDDFIGADINKSSRLCAIARPYGVVIDRDDFPTLPSLPKRLKMQLFPQVRRLGGIPEDVSVWVTKEIASQFITRENIRETPEVHVAGLCLKEDRALVLALVAKRSPSRQLYPGLFEGCGGQLAVNELFATGVKRHYRLELQIDVDVVEEVHHFYYIQHPGLPNIPGIAFLCVYKAGQPQSENHSEVRWVTEEELKGMPPELFIPGVKERYLEFIDAYRRLARDR